VGSYFSTERYDRGPGVSSRHAGWNLVDFVMTEAG